jgi:hypothetical protein
MIVEGDKQKDNYRKVKYPGPWKPSNQAKRWYFVLIIIFICWQLLMDDYHFPEYQGDIDYEQSQSE